MKLPIDLGLLGLSLGVAGAVLVFDLLTGPAIAASVGYVGLVLLGWRSSWPPFALWLAALATALVAVGALAAPAGFSDSDAVNRGLALALVWATAILCNRQRRAARRLEPPPAELRHQKDRAASSADRAVRALHSERDDRARIEEELEEAEQRYRAVFNQTYQFVAVLDPDGAVEEANETMRALGLSPSDTAGAPVWALPIWTAEERERLKGAVSAAAAGDFVRDEFRARHGSGEDIVVDLSLKPIRNPEGRVDLIILEARDITQHKRDQTRLIQTQKMEVLGQFASGIAHDFNNLLTVIAGNLELAERRVKDDETAAKRIANAMNAVFQGRSLTDRILSFSRKKQLLPRSVEVKEVVAEAISLSQSGLDENTQIVSDIAPDVWPCWSDPAQLQTALLNLMINARDAMPHGGRVLVRASNFTIQPDVPGERPDLPSGDYAVVSVSDEGTGIPEQILEKVTDPFFTTKKRGSGLGLSMVAEFAEASDGELRIDSSEGRGTTVSLYLPRARRPVEDAEPRRETSVSRGQGRVLVVESDPEVRDAAVAMLSELGYRTAAAANGEEALGIMRRGGAVDLLLADIATAGDTDEGDLGPLARAIRPDLAMLYSSEGPEATTELRADQGLRDDFIAKPYHTAELAQKIESLLSRDAKGDRSGR